ncbi:hypothetical protein IFO70_23585 [Phormidium tenue FACHB-886]|nr:hypothetical protein [Phormidium tenue FACHB-886]
MKRIKRKVNLEQLQLIPESSEEVICGGQIKLSDCLITSDSSSGTVEAGRGVPEKEIEVHSFSWG